MTRNWTDWEGQEQAALFDWSRRVKLSVREPDASGNDRLLTLGEVLLWIPNGVGKLKPQVAQKMKDQGLSAGFPDLFLPIALHGFHGCMLEFKASHPHSATVTANQSRWILRLQRQGYATAVVYGWQDAAKKLSAYIAGSWWGAQ